MAAGVVGGALNSLPNSLQRHVVDVEAVMQTPGDVLQEGIIGLPTGHHQMRRNFDLRGASG